MTGDYYSAFLFEVSPNFKPGPSQFDFIFVLETRIYLVCVFL
jgi:hypothetical protein